MRGLLSTSIFSKTFPHIIKFHPGRILPATLVRPNSGIAYNEQDLKRFEQAFRTIPSYRGESIGAEDLPTYLKTISYERTPEQLEKYKEFCYKFTEGKLYLKDLLRFLITQHNPNQILREYAIIFDKDKDGFISESEYEYGTEVLRVHDPGVVRDVTYKEFVKQADTNKDGKVSIDELTKWLEGLSRVIQIFSSSTTKSAIRLPALETIHNHN